MVEQLILRLKEQEMDLELTDAAKEKITDEGYDPEYGARPLEERFKNSLKIACRKSCLKAIFPRDSTY